VIFLTSITSKLQKQTLAGLLFWVRRA
jgi:hypothetical protein